MKTWVKWTIGVTAGVAVATAIAVPVGLYLSGYWDKKNFVTIEYKVNSGLSEKTRNANTQVNVYDPAFNKDAQEKLQDFAKDLTTKELQRDFDKVLTDFYEAYEEENAQYEMEIEDIRVKSKNNDGSFSLDVYYEIEYEKYNLQQSRDREEIKKETINWTPKFTVLTPSDIQSIKNQMQVLGKNDNKHGVDLKDLKEIFLGKDHDKDDPDDIGIFDRVQMLNKDYNGMASMVAYDLSINDIYGELNKQRSRAAGDEITKETHFRIPSISLNNGESSVALVPNEKPSVNIDNSKSHLQGITEQELNSLPPGTYTEKQKINEYLSFIFGTSDQPANIKEVVIAQKDQDGFVKVSINFNDEKTSTEIFYLYVSK